MVRRCGGICAVAVWVSLGSSARADGPLDGRPPQAVPTADTDPGPCEWGAPMLRGRIDLHPLGSIPFDALKATVTLEHKLDVDAAEDRCISAVVVNGRLDERGCVIALRFAARPGSSQLHLTEAQIDADSFCPGWIDTVEGTYTLDGNQPQAVATLSRRAVDARTASTTCVENIAISLDADFPVSAAGTSGERHRAQLRGVSIEGPIRSLGMTEALCPAAPPAPVVPAAPKPRPEPGTSALTLTAMGGFQRRYDVDAAVSDATPMNPDEIGASVYATVMTLRPRVALGQRLWFEAESRLALWEVQYKSAGSDLVVDDFALRAGLWLVGARADARTRVGLRASGATLDRVELQPASGVAVPRRFDTARTSVGSVGAAAQWQGDRLRADLVGDIGRGGAGFATGGELALAFRLGSRVELGLLSGVDVRRFAYEFGDESTPAESRSAESLVFNQMMGITLRSCVRSRTDGWCLRR